MKKKINVNVKANNSYEKNNYVNCNRKDIERSSKNFANCDVNNKNEIENTNS